jgi:tetratricopeptide (TPR) repeat protein
MLAAQRAMAEGEYELAAQRLIYARDAEPRNIAVLRLMTLAFWQAGKLDEAARAVRDWARVDPKRPAAHRFAARIYEDMGAVDLAEEAAARAARRGPSDAGAWERLGRLRVMLMDREGALAALRKAVSLGAGGEAHDLIARALAIEPRMEHSAAG